MRFNKISFDNYRCFLNGTIEFPKSDTKSLTILVAPNGGGKTETLFSFWWCLYDFDFNKVQDQSYAVSMRVVSESDFSSLRPLKFDAKILLFLQICKFLGWILSKKIQNDSKKTQNTISGNEQRWKRMSNIFDENAKKGKRNRHAVLHGGCRAVDINQISRYSSNSSNNSE